MVRRFAAFAVIFILSMIAAPGTNKAVAQDGYPTRPVKFLVPYPSGGTNDVVAQSSAISCRRSGGNRSS